MRRVLLPGLFLFPRLLGAQASPYIPLDDPRLPAFDLLVARGEVRDPSPMVRPFLANEALEALLAADTVGAVSRRLIQELRAAWVRDTAPSFYSMEARVGGEGYTNGRRDPLQDDEGEGIAAYGELRGELRAGPFIAVSRPAIEPRLNHDPDWRGRTDLTIVGRMIEGYVGGQWRYGRVLLGAIDRQWGPDGVAGIPLSANAYPRTEFAFDIGTPRLRLSAHGAQLTDGADSAGARVHRFWFAHRLSVMPSSRLAVSLWETTVIGGTDREFDGRWRNPAAVLLLSNQYGLGADGNIMVGGDLSWWARPALRLEGQFALDDFNYPDPNSNDKTPSRYAFTLAASGPLARTAAWKLLYTQASSLAFRASRDYENYADAGVGLGRGYSSSDQFTARVTFPIATSWTVSPEATLLRRGDAALTDSFPTSAASGGDVPVLFIGTVERTWRGAVTVSGAHGPVRAAGEIGLHYVQNVGHQEGESELRPVARFRLSLGIGTGGPLQ